jgi:hypothetical protein
MWRHTEDRLLRRGRPWYPYREWSYPKGSTGQYTHAFKIRYRSRAGWAIKLSNSLRHKENDLKRKQCFFKRPPMAFINNLVEDLALSAEHHLTRPRRHLYFIWTTSNWRVSQWRLPWINGKSTGQSSGNREKMATQAQLYRLLILVNLDIIDFVHQYEVTRDVPKIEA